MITDVIEITIQIQNTNILEYIKNSSEYNQKQISLKLN